MKIFNANRQKNLEFNDILQKIKYKADKEAVDGFIYFPLFKISDRGIEHQEDPTTQILFNRLKEMGAIEFSGRTCDEINKTLEEAKTSKDNPFIVEGYWVKPIEPKFSQLCEEYEKSGGEKTTDVRLIPDKYKISVKDREIWVNDYLIGKPHAVGSNLEFFDYIRAQKPHTKIDRDKLPSNFGDLSIQGQVKKKGFIKILNGLGFKGEILRAFFSKRGKDTLIYAGDEISKEDLENVGVKIPLFIQELKLAHTKNSPV